MVTSSSGAISTSGSAAPGVTSSSSATTSNGSSPVGSAPSRTVTTLQSIEPTSAARIRFRRSASANTILDPESASANTSSSVCHQAFIGTATAPTEVIAANAAIHSG